MNRRLKFGSVVTAAALALSSFTVLASSAHAADGPVLSASADGGLFSPFLGLPLIDSEIGFGAGLSAATAREIPVPGFAGNGAALVRISVLSPTTDAVLAVAGTQAIAVSAGVSASTTVLAPIVQGKITITADAAVEVRIEIIGTYAGTDAGPGGMVALAQPVKRADSVEDVAVVGSDTGVSKVGVVGKGGVPSTDVRAVFITLTAEATAPSSARIGTQEIALAAGKSAISTLVPVDASGEIELAGAFGDAKVQLFVRGYVKEAAQNQQSLNAVGGFVPSPAAAGTTAHLTDSVSELNLQAPADARHLVLAVSARAATETTVLDIGQPYAGRGHGVVVTKGHASQPQIVVADLDEAGSLKATLRRGAADVTVTVLGSIVSDAQRNAAAPQLAVLSPAAGSTVDLTHEATFTATGTVSGPQANLDRVNVTLDGALLGTASVVGTAAGYDFSFETSMLATGDYTLGFEAVDRRGGTSTSSVAVHVDVHGEGDPVVSSQVIVHDGEGAADLRASTPTSLTYATDPGVLPGQFLVGRDDDAAPEGYLRQVLALDQTAAGFEVTTGPAAITDIILQADIDQQVGLIRTPGTTLYPDATTTPSAITVDPQAPLLLRALNLEADASIGETTGLYLKLLKTAEYEKDLSREPTSTYEGHKAEVKASGGAALNAKVELSVSLDFKLRIDFVQDHVWELPHAELKTFSVILQRQAEASIDGSVYGDVEVNWEKELGSWNLGRVKFMVGPVPVWLTTTADLTLKGVMTAEAKISASWSGRDTQRYGFEYGPGGARAVNPWPPIENAPLSLVSEQENVTESDFGASAAVKATFGPELTFFVGIYDAAGPTIQAGARAGTEASIEYGKDIAWSVFIEGNIGIGIRFRVPIIDHVLLDETLVESGWKRIDLLSNTIPWSRFASGAGTGTGPGEPPVPGPVDPIEIPEIGFKGSSLRATLYWDNKSDLDLWVGEPDGNLIGYSNRGPSSTGGQLDIDSNAGCSISNPSTAGGLENIYWGDTSQAPAGTYSVRVSEYSRCGFPEHANWVLKVYVDEQLRFQQTGNTDQQFSFTLNGPQALRVQALIADNTVLQPTKLTPVPDIAKAPAK